MKKALHILLVVVAVLASTLVVAAKSPSAKAVFTVEPKMVCTNCENKIQSNLRFEKGISLVEASAANQTVTVTYNPDKTSVDNIIAGFKKIGYTATQTTEQAACTENHGCCCCKAKATTADTCATKQACCKEK